MYLYKRHSSGKVAFFLGFLMEIAKSGNRQRNSDRTRLFKSHGWHHPATMIPVQILSGSGK
jgi:hypothetical protein